MSVTLVFLIMFDENILLFILVTFLGFAITFWGTRNKSEYRRYVITLGIVVAHVGLFGILYDKLSLMPFVTLVLFVVSLFVLIDPLKLSGFFPQRLCRVLGLTLLFASFAFFLMSSTGFRVWLWIFPFTLYVIPYTIPSWRAKKIYFQFWAGILVLGFLVLIGHKIYSGSYPEARVESLETLFNLLSPKSLEMQDPFPHVHTASQPDLSLIHNPIPAIASETPHENPKVENTHRPADTHSVVQTNTIQNSTERPVIQNGPLVESLKEFDQKYLELKLDYSRLQEKYREALHEIEILKSENEGLKSKILIPSEATP